MSKREIIVAKSAGFCFGVRRAVQIAEDLGRAGTSACTLGPIIHNTHVVEHLRGLGVPSVDAVEDLPAGALAVIRSHGVPKAVYQALEQKGIDYVDATCPYVEKIHSIVREHAQKGKRIVVIGARAHPEVLGIAGQCADAVVIENETQLLEALDKQPELRNQPVCVVAQTTIGRKFWESCLEILKKECTNCEIFDTICFATSKRQAEAAELSARSDMMVVIGDRTSSNTRGLVGICRTGCAHVLAIESAQELDLESLVGVCRIGVTAGASTPDWIIKEVVNKMSEEIKKSAAENAEAPEAEPQEVKTGEGESFEEMLEHSFKTLNTGDKVTGIVTAITPTEIYVDLGTKHAGFIPIAEISDDPEIKAEEVFKVGDEVEAYVVRVNDVEGVITLSKRRLDAIKSWDDIEVARQDKVVVEGTVIDENKGGIIVSVKGSRVFVPASQTGLPKDAPMSEMLKRKVKLRITEVNRPRKRVVGSIRSVLMDERKAAAEKVWSEIEVGKVYQGVVKSLTSYGAFVDIGGVDGMVHISQMSWSRIGHPSEMFKVGDQVEVYVIALDPEKKKISLGYRKEADNPWNKFLQTYQIGDVAKVKIVKMMPFGAFAEVLPGVDGLIHISQITNRRIARPGEVLTEGQEAEAKIIDIDLENKKISLSMRALIPGEDAGDREPEPVAGEDEIVATAEPPKEEAPTEEAPAEVAPVEEAAEEKTEE